MTYNENTPTEMIIEQLRPYIELSNDELGEYLQLMSALARYDYFFSSEFAAAWKEELINDLKRMEREFDIAEEEVQITKRLLTLIPKGE